MIFSFVIFRVILIGFGVFMVVLVTYGVNAGGGRVVAVCSPHGDGMPAWGDIANIFIRKCNNCVAKNSTQLTN